MNTSTVSNVEFWKNKQKRRNDIFLSFHGSEILNMLVGKPSMREFIEDYLLKDIHKKWKDHCQRTDLVVFFDDSSIDGEISDDIIAGIYCLQASNEHFNI